MGEVNEKDTIACVINWNLPIREFKKSIGEMVRAYQDGGKVIPLPIELKSGPEGMSILTALLAKIDCGNCSECCKSKEHLPDGEIFVDPLEFDDLQKKYPELMARVPSVQSPCPLLLSKGRCGVYNDRPFTCWLYPFQFGGFLSDGFDTKLASLSAACPEARKLAKSLYLNRYQLRNSLIRLGIIKKEEA